MKNLFSADRPGNGTDIALLITRLGIAALMLTHGMPKMATLFSGEPVQFIPFMGLSAKASMGLAVFAEVICSFLLIIGFATRLAVIPLMITMLVALTSVHAADPFVKQEPALHYLLVYFVLLITGSGRYSIDGLVKWSERSNREVKMKRSELAMS